MFRDSAHSQAERFCPLQPVVPRALNFILRQQITVKVPIQNIFPVLASISVTRSGSKIACGSELTFRGVEGSGVDNTAAPLLFWCELSKSRRGKITRVLFISHFHPNVIIHQGLLPWNDLVWSWLKNYVYHIVIIIGPTHTHLDPI